MLRGGRRSAGAILRLGSEGPDRASVRPGNAGRTPQLAGRGSSLSTSLGPRHSVPPMDGVPADEMSACQGGRTSSSGQGGLSSALTSADGDRNVPSPWKSLRGQRGRSENFSSHPGRKSGMDWVQHGTRARSRASPPAAPPVEFVVFYCALVLSHLPVYLFIFIILKS